MTTAVTRTATWAEWLTKAACKETTPTIWFPASSGDRCVKAKGICLRCPVRRACGQEAADTNERHAVRAGFRCSDPDERAALREWLGMTPAASHTRACNRCGAQFQTRNGRHLACPGCRAFVPADTCRLHIRRLNAAGVSYRRIAQDAQVAVRTITTIAADPARTGRRCIRRDIAHRILTVTTEQEGRKSA